MFVKKILTLVMFLSVLLTMPQKADAFFLGVPEEPSSSDKSFTAVVIQIKDKDDLIVAYQSASTIKEAIKTAMAICRREALDPDNCIVRAYYPTGQEFVLLYCQRQDGDLTLWNSFAVSAPYDQKGEAFEIAMGKANDKGYPRGVCHEWFRQEAVDSQTLSEEIGAQPTVESQREEWKSLLITMSGHPYFGDVLGSENDAKAYVLESCIFQRSLEECGDSVVTVEPDWYLVGYYCQLDNRAGPFVAASKHDYYTARINASKKIGVAGYSITDDCNLIYRSDAD